MHWNEGSKNIFKKWSPLRVLALSVLLIPRTKNPRPSGAHHPHLYQNRSGHCGSFLKMKLRVSPFTQRLNWQSHQEMKGTKSQSNKNRGHSCHLLSWNIKINYDSTWTSRGLWRNSRNHPMELHGGSFSTIASSEPSKCPAHRKCSIMIWWVKRQIKGLLSKSKEVLGMKEGTSVSRSSTHEFGFWGV